MPLPHVLKITTRTLHVLGKHCTGVATALCFLTWDIVTGLSISQQEGSSLLFVHLSVDGKGIYSFLK